MVRVDVFSLKNTKGKNAGKDEWYMVPVYPHQVVDKKGWPQPPMMAVAGGKSEQDWHSITAAHEFRFSIYPKSYIEVVKSDGLVLDGYFQGLDRALGAITLSNHKDPRATFDNHSNSMRNIGAKTLLTINKYSVDRFGNRFKVGNEVRTWHGVACTYPSPPG
jgi:CRISPR-associated endonuclease Csn1